MPETKHEAPKIPQAPLKPSLEKSPSKIESGKNKPADHNDMLGGLMGATLGALFPIITLFGIFF